VPRYINEDAIACYYVGNRAIGLGVIISGKSTGEGWLDEDKIDTNRAERAGVAVFSAWQPPWQGLDIAKIHRKRQPRSQRGLHPVDADYM